MRVYQGLDIIYSEDDSGYYAQDFNDPKQPASQVFQSVEDLKEAIDSGKIKLK